MSVRGFLTWYILAIVFVGIIGASAVQGLKLQRAEQLSAASEAVVDVPATPRRDIAAAEAGPATTPASPPALQAPPSPRQHVPPRTVARHASHISKRSVVAKAEHPVIRRPGALAAADPAKPNRDYPRGPYAAPWQAYAAYPSSPPPPYPPYVYRAYGPYVPAYVRYGWPQPPYYSDF